MSEKDFAGKLAAGMRRAKQPPSLQPDAAAPAAFTPGGKDAATMRVARQADLVPPVSPDDPWDNLHPERIWPD